VRLQHGGGHYYRGRVPLELTHSTKVAKRLELVTPCLGQKGDADPIAFKSLLGALGGQCKVVVKTGAGLSADNSRDN
jgi:hypothetical protein